MFWNPSRTVVWCLCSIQTTRDCQQPSIHWIPTAARLELLPFVLLMADMLQWCHTRSAVLRCGSGRGCHLHGSHQWPCHLGCVCSRTRSTGVWVLTCPSVTVWCTDCTVVPRTVYHGYKQISIDCHYAGCLQLLEILEISWNFIDAPGSAKIW